MKRLGIVALLASLAGCGTFGGDRIEQEVASSVRDNDRQILESRTLGSLAKLEASLADYIKTEGRIPGKLEDLIPKYLAEMPTVETGVSKHRETSASKIYPADILRDGVVQGTRLSDSGRWGYVFNERQVVVFVDCTHQDSKGTPWYQQRGVY